MTTPSWKLSDLKERLSQGVSILPAPDKLARLVICVGIILRLVRYLSNRSLWLDEAMLAINITERSFPELLQPLDYEQKSPVGFLFLEKLAVQVFGNSEYALRFFPLLAGIISLFLFHLLARRIVGPRSALVALGLFAVLEPLVYFSSEAKHYSSDVTIALLILFVALRLRTGRPDASSIALCGVVGAASIWFSYPSIFVLGGVALSLTLFKLAERDWANISRLSFAYMLWALSLSAFYLVSIRRMTNTEEQLRYFRRSFMPLPPLSLSEAKWFISTFFSIFYDPVGFTFAGIGAFTFLVGCVSLYLEKRREFLILLSPALFTLAASGLEQYPFEGRLILFLVPSILILIAAGVEHIRVSTRRGSAVIGIILVGLLFCHPVFKAASSLTKPRARQEIKPVLSYIRDHQQAGDGLYVSQASQPAFSYYAERFGFKRENHLRDLSMINRSETLMGDLEKFRGHPRVWMLFTNLSSEDQERLVLCQLDRIGTRIDTFKSVEAAAYLYDLSRASLGLNDTASDRHCSSSFFEPLWIAGCAGTLARYPTMINAIDDKAASSGRACRPRVCSYPCARA